MKIPLIQQTLIQYPNTLVNNKNHPDALNSAVTRLEANHLPTLAQYTDRKELTEKIFTTRDKNALQEFCDEIKNMKSELFTVRENTFIIVNSGTSEVYGKLKESGDLIGRDKYIQQLHNFYCLRDEIQKEFDYSEIQLASVSEALYLHHSSGVYGDLHKLHELINHRPGIVPQLDYNQGIDQF